MNSVVRNILERRSARSYDESKPVAENDLMTILKAGAYAPSAKNAQAWHFTAVCNRDKLLQLNDAVKVQMGQSDVARNVARSKDGAYNFYYHAPVLIIVSVSDSALYPREDAACALENMFLAAESLGLGSCWINQLNGLCDEPSVRMLLGEYGIPADHQVHGICALGHIARETSAKPRKSTVIWV